MPKLLFASRKPLAPYGEGGGETIAHDLLSALTSWEDFEVRALGAFRYDQMAAINRAARSAGINLRYAQRNETIELLDGTLVPVPRFGHIDYRLPDAYPTTLAREDHYLASLDRLLVTLAPDVVLLQGEGALEIWARLIDRDGLTFLYLQNGFEIDVFLPHRFPRLPRLLANSEGARARVRRDHGLACELLYPAIRAERYRGDGDRGAGGRGAGGRPTKHPEDPESPTGSRADRRLTVLFVNPVEIKGVDVFLHLVAHFPELDFVALEGWRPIDPGLRARLAAYPNARCLDRTWHMAEVYRQADLLIVPSRWDAFGRVVVEAHAAGVPTLASRVGGLPEASGEAGFLVDDYTSPAAWEAALRELVRDLLCDPTRLDAARARFEANVERFTPEKAAACFAEIVRCARDGSKG